MFVDAKIQMRYADRCASTMFQSFPISFLASLDKATADHSHGATRHETCCCAETDSGRVPNGTHPQILFSAGRMLNKSIGGVFGCH